MHRKIQWQTFTSPVDGGSQQGREDEGKDEDEGQDEDVLVFGLENYLM